MTSVPLINIKTERGKYQINVQLLQRISKIDFWESLYFRQVKR